MNSREKGKTGEREAAAFLSAHGFPARRGLQFSGSPDSPDVICPSLAGVHFEVKFTQRNDLEGWLTQAATDGAGKLPVVLHRKKRGPWIAVLRAEDLLALLRASPFAHVGVCNETRLPGPSGEASNGDRTMNGMPTPPSVSMKEVAR